MKWLQLGINENQVDAPHIVPGLLLALGSLSSQKAHLGNPDWRGRA